MNHRIILALGVSAILAQSDAFAAKPRHKRTTTPSSQRTVVQQKSTAVVPPQTYSSTSSTPAFEIDLEQAHYEQAKARAKQDPEVKALKAKADQAATAEEARRTSIAYNQMLFRKMRQIDRSVAERVDLVEAAILKRINESM